MFEPDGRHFKTFVGKDYLDQMLDASDEGMVRIDLDGEDRMAASDNRMALVEGRVDLVQRDLKSSHQRLNVVVARASEDSDAVVNEK